MVRFHHFQTHENWNDPRVDPTTGEPVFESDIEAMSPEARARLETLSGIFTVAWGAVEGATPETVRAATGLQALSIDGLRIAVTGDTVGVSSGSPEVESWRGAHVAIYGLRDRFTEAALVDLGQQLAQQSQGQAPSSTE